jgi:hypothetical protein
VYRQKEETALKIYVAGPMSIVGPPTWNFPAFEAATYMLRREGHTVFNPAEHEMDTYRENLQIDLDWICREADMLYMLRGWEKSPGANAEFAVAKALGLQFRYE